MISLLNVTFFLLAEQCVKAYSYHGKELSKEDGSELWFWHVLMPGWHYSNWQAPKHVGSIKDGQTVNSLPLSPTECYSAATMSHRNKENGQLHMHTG